jgi:hypothetical protein
VGQSGGDVRGERGPKRPRGGGAGSGTRWIVGSLGGGVYSTPGWTVRIC